MKKSAQRKSLSRDRTEELQELRATAVNARREYERFNEKYSKKYLQDHRVTAAGIVLVDKNTRDDHHAGAEERRAAERQQKVDDFQSDSYQREELRRAANDAERRAKDLETAIAEEISEPSARAELADAIARLSEGTATVTKLRDAHSRARDAVAAAQMRSHDTAAAVNAAVEYQTRTFEAALEQGFAVDRDGSVREARAKAADAEEELATAQQAEESLRTKLANADNVLSESRETVQRLSARILTGSLADLLRGAAAARSDLIGREKVLSYLAKFAPQEQRREVDSFLSEAWLWPSVHEPADRHPAVAPWLATRNELMVDAAAPLPGSGAT